MHPLRDFKFCPRCGSENFYEKLPNSKECGSCGLEFFKNPAPAVAAIVFDDQGRLLVTRRMKEPAKGTLDLPGGFIDLGETAEDAVIREIKEELNIEVEIGKYLFCIPNNYMYKGIDARSLDFFFECKIKDMSNIKAEEAEISEILFLKPESINPEDFGLDSIREGIKRLLEQITIK